MVCFGIVVFILAIFMLQQPYWIDFLVAPAVLLERYTSPAC